MGWAIALHGGAGDIPVDLPAERREPREAALRRILQIGVSALNAKCSPVDVVELVVFSFTSFKLLFQLHNCCSKRFMFCSYHLYDLF